MLEKFEIKRRFTDIVLFTAEIEIMPDMSWRFKLGLAVKSAVAKRADLSGADLSGANLSGANLSGANLSRADLYGANLSGADLSRADLYGAVNADLQIARTRILPDEGDIIGWKKCRNDVIVKLKITDGTPRSHAFGRKCRAQSATVLEIIGAEKAYSSHDPKFSYEVGQCVEALNWSENWMEECAGGIHFFITQAEARAY